MAKHKRKNQPQHAHVTKPTVPAADSEQESRSRDASKLQALQLQELKVQHLKLIIRSLRAPWWTKPSTLASFAATAAAILALVWGATTGFFDVTKRELEVTKRELQAENAMLE